MKDVHDRLYAKTEARFPRSPRGAAAPEPAPVAVLAYGRDVDEILGLVATAFRRTAPAAPRGAGRSNLLSRTGCYCYGARTRFVKALVPVVAGLPGSGSG